MKLRWGVMGTGGIARLFTRDLVTDGHVVVAVGSRNDQRARAFAADWRIPHAHSSYESLVHDPRVDIVYVATPHSEHFNNTLLAVEAGKHVLVEKPFMLNESEARRAYAAANAAGVVVLEAMWTRFLPHMALVRSLISAGRIGQVLAVHAEHAQRLVVADDHRLRRLDLGGGALLDLGIYPLSFLHDIVGEPVEVVAHAEFVSTGVDTSLTTSSRHPGGVLAGTFSSMLTPGRNEATIHGSLGRIDIGPVFYAPTTVTVSDESGTVVASYFDRPAGRGMQFQAQEMERLVTTGESQSSLMTHRDSIGVIRTMDRIRGQIGLHFPGEDG